MRYKFERMCDFTSKKFRLIELLAILSAILLVLNISASSVSAADNETANWVRIPTKVDPILQGLNIPADAATKGMWSSTIPWSINALHAILLSDGRLLTFGTPFGNPAAQDGRYYDIWNPQEGFQDSAHIKSVVPDPVNSFCSTAGWLTDGTLMVAGGNGNNGRSSGLFNSANNNSLNNSSTMAGQRWYASMVGLTDGRQLILGGTVPYTNPTYPTPEIFENGAWRSLFGASSTSIFASNAIGSQQAASPWYYPRAWLSPNGNVFGITSSIIFSINPDANNRNGSITNLGNFKTPQDSSSATTPNVGFSSTAVMFAPGKILQVGGNGISDNNPNLSSKNATIIDINADTPVIIETNPMNFRRHWSNATVIPNGKVVVTGGTTIGWNPDSRVAEAEIWDPDAKNWLVGARNAQTRTYHSTALLLPNGTIFTGGGGAPGAVNNLNAEIYYPPNLFTSTNGVSQLAARPVISYVSSLSLAYGDTLGVQMANTKSISRLALIHTGSVTHSFNNTQRYVPLNFTQNGSILNARLPSNANLIPRGYYMLFAVDVDGVYSSSVMLGVGGLKAPALGYVPPGLPENASLCSSENGQCTIPAGFTGYVYYGANGAYNQLKVQSGVINCNNVTFGDPSPGAAKSCFVELVQVTEIPNINASIVSAGSVASYSPTVNLVNAQYSWNFGDNTASTPFSLSPNVTHVYTKSGLYQVQLTAKLSDGKVINKNFVQAVSTGKTSNTPTHSSPIVVETRSGNSARIWTVNPDNDSVSVIDANSKAVVATINVGASPRTIAIAPDGRIWVTNKKSATLSVISPSTLAVVQTINLARASQPHGLAFSPTGSHAFVVLEAKGQLLKLNPSTGAQVGFTNIGNHPRHLSINADGSRIFVSRFITLPLPGESTVNIDTSTKGGEVVVVNAVEMITNQTITLKYSDKVDNEFQGSGIPNYLGAAVISPDGSNAWIPSKQDNIKRGIARSGINLDFQNTVRAISSRINLNTLSEEYAKRVDHDNSSVGAAAVYHPSGVYLFVALETSRQVAVVDAIAGSELFKINIGRAPQGLTLSADGNTLYVQEFMDRSVSIIDLSPLLKQGQLRATVTNVIATVSAAQEKLSASVVLGKQLFYDAKDTRLARDSYMSCASCHNDGSHDGRVWDLTGFGEGLRNTINLKGRAGMSHGFLHWSANFDEVQDFEKQIRDLAGGLGLMTDPQYNTGTRNQALGDKKAGVSTNLDELAGYVASLNSFDESPNRNADGTLTTAATAGKAIFNTQCASCHGGANFTASTDGNGLKSIGTINALSGKRLNGNLTGLDVPTLRDVWATAPYLHNGSASTLTAAVQAHNNLNLSAADLTNVIAYIEQIDSNTLLLSQGKPSTQSSLENGGVASRAVDGNTSGIWTNNSVTHTANEAQPWWQVDLGQVYAISQINLWNRTDCCSDRLQKFYVLSSNNDMTGKTLAQLLADPNVKAQQIASLNGASNLLLSLDNIQARYVRIQLNDVNPLSLAEVQVYGGEVGPNTNVVSQGKTTTQSSVDEGGVPSRALDGNNNGEYANGSITHTLNENQPWWQVDLGQTSTVSQVTLWNRLDTCCMTRLQNFYVFASNTDMTGKTLAQLLADNSVKAMQVSSLNGLANITVQMGAVQARYVRVQLAGTGILSLAEVQVLGGPAISQSTANASPTIAITSPASGKSYIQGENFSFTATANDSDGVISKVEYYYNTDQLLATLNQAPYTLNGSTAGVLPADYIITAKAYDDKGAITTSAPITVAIKSASQNKAPTVSITTPTANINLARGATYTITANASDSDGTIQGVEIYYNGDNLLATLTSAPYTISGSTINVPAGSYSITAKAYDNVGASTTSQPVVITIGQ